MWPCQDSVTVTSDQIPRYYEIISIEINIKIKVSVELHQFLQPGHLWPSLLALQPLWHFKPCMCMYMYSNTFMKRKQHAAAFFHSGVQSESPTLSTLGDPETSWAHQKAGCKMSVLHLQLTSLFLSFWDLRFTEQDPKTLVCFRDLKRHRKH